MIMEQLQVAPETKLCTCLAFPQRAVQPQMWICGHLPQGAVRLVTQCVLGCCRGHLQLLRVPCETPAWPIFDDQIQMKGCYDSAALLHLAAREVHLFSWQLQPIKVVRLRQCVSQSGQDLMVTWTSPRH